jgi:uncharacterized protein (TIGR02145 family)
MVNTVFGFKKYSDIVIGVFISFTLFFSLTGCNNMESVKIGSQTWSAKNLDVTTFQNGDSIPEARTIDEWAKAALNKKPAWCYYENKKENNETFGKLYNWYAVTDERKLCPKGWHIPSAAEWQTLEDFLGGFKVSGGKLKSKQIWNGEDPYGFGALPAGYRMDCIYARVSNHSNDDFYSIRTLGLWWSTSETKYEPSKNGVSVAITSESFMWISNPIICEKGSGQSVRCIAD